MMHKFDYWSPTEVVFGKGREDETAAYVKKYGGSKVLLVYGGGSVERSGLLQRVKEQLDAAGIGYAEFGGVQPNPTVEYAREGVKRAIESQADFILAVGGGSAIDTAKGIAHGAANPDVDIRTSDSREGLMRQLAAGGFKDITRIASSSPDMWESICLENQGQLLKVIDAYKASLEDISEAIRENRGDKLHCFFEEAKDYRDSMPMKMKGSIEPAYEIYVDLIDESGAIATIATILASNRISIKNIGILHNREFQEGVLRIEFYEQDAVEKATALLSKYSYIIHTR